VSFPGDLDDVILEVVGAVPAGALATYGDVAGLVSELGHPCGPRRVARSLSMFGGSVPWWRVVHSAGTLAEPVAGRARELLAAEGIHTDGRRVPLATHRWHPDEAALRALAETVGPQRGR
jgi:alkylated DNA nucleotide flippase Atl1